MEKTAIQSIEKKTQISFSIRQADKTYFVLVENIAFIYLKNQMVYLVDFNDNKHLISKTLEFLENVLPSQQFYRINRQMMVSRKAIKNVATHTNQRIVVHLTLPTTQNAIVPRAKIKPFLTWIEKG